MPIILVLRLCLPRARKRWCGLRHSSLCFGGPWDWACPIWRGDSRNREGHH